MNKRELIAAASKRSGISQQELLKNFDAIFDTTKKTLFAGECVHIRGFCSFHVNVRKGRKYCNPQTNKVQFSADKRIVTPKMKPGFLKKMNQ